MKKSLKTNKAETPSQQPLLTIVKGRARRRDNLREIRDSMRLQPEGRRRVLASFLENLETIFSEQAFNSCFDVTDGGGSHSTNPYIERWIGELSPWLKTVDQEVKAMCEGNSIGDNYFDSRFRREETAYSLGILAGARLAGYSRERLQTMCNHLAETLE